LFENKIKTKNHTLCVLSDVVTGMGQAYGGFWVGDEVEHLDEIGGMVCDREPAGKRGGEKHPCAKKKASQNAKSFLLLVLHRQAPKNSTNRKPTKDFIGGMFLGWCAIKNREQRTKKIKKQSNVAQIPKKNPNSVSPKKKIPLSDLDLSGKKISQALLAKKEKEKIKKKPKIQKSHPQNAKSFFLLVLHRHVPTDSST